MTETRCGIWLCEWVGDLADLREHELAEHPTAVRARGGLARWRRIVGEDSTPDGGAEAQGRESSAAAGSSPESSPKRQRAVARSEVGPTGSRPRITRFCVYCGAKPRNAWSSTCASCADLEHLDEVVA